MRVNKGIEAEYSKYHTLKDHGYTMNGPRKKIVNLAVLHKFNQLDKENVEIALKNQ